MTSRWKRDVSWKDYRHRLAAQTEPPPPAEEFARRFLLHVLPPGLQRIRHYGLLANCTREVKLQRCRQLLDSPAPVRPATEEAEDYRDRYERLTGVSLWDCPQCGKGQMVRIESFLPGTLPRGPPGVAS